MLAVVTMLLMWFAWRWRQYFWSIVTLVTLLVLVCAWAFADTAQWVIALSGAMTGLVLWPVVLPRRAL
ncbi:hypothetical protein [Gallaecimonas mangrovi]|uniref:hypothetical protein n=1 Tax=Gallaecimonas mangrovi TaxID=2291597 RepID=UPI000E205F8F|nr:hypothetical protein [Gallaecimonas mangrovi]